MLPDVRLVGNPDSVFGRPGGAVGFACYLRGLTAGLVVMRQALFFACLLMLICQSGAAQSVIDEDELGAWYTYGWTDRPNERGWGFQGTLQYRNWDIVGDLEQLLTNFGPTYTAPGRRTQYALNYAFIRSGAYGSSSATRDEHRLIEEALIPGRLGPRVFVLNRFRLEQRWIDGQDFRNRVRWMFLANLPLNRPNLKRGAVYLSFYNELFFNLEEDIGAGRQVDYFDRNRTYLALGYSFTDDLRGQFGYMYQRTDNTGKGQLQFNVLQWF